MRGERGKCDMLMVRLIGDSSLKVRRMSDLEF